MYEWHEALPGRYRLVERFNHSALATLPPKTPGNGGYWRTLEVGAGIGGHVPFEDLSNQEYHCLELRPKFCEALRRIPGLAGVHQSDIQSALPFSTAAFDRVVAIHVLEHLRDLPAALAEIGRVLTVDGIFDVVLPCEGSLAYSLGRRLSAKPMFERRFRMPYAPIIANEHVNTLSEVLDELKPLFAPQTVRRFPFNVPIDSINLCIAMRLHKRGRSHGRLRQGPLR